MANTPPVFAVWMINKTLHWLQRNGGVAQMQANAAKRSGLLYDCIEFSSGFYRCPIQPGYRSHMNVVFRLPTEELEKRFLEQATGLGLMHLRGHRVVGGIRASIYNAMPIKGVESLVEHMQDFQKKHG